MRMKTIYFFWALLPVALLFFGINASLKRVGKNPTKEYPKDYFKQVFFCGIILAIAIAFDLYAFDLVISFLPVDPQFIGVIRFFVYPAFLLGIAVAQSIITGEDKKKAKIRSKPYSRF